MPVAMTNQVYLGLGTNLGERRANLQRAVWDLSELVIVEAISPVYETEPWGVSDQPWFLNMCLAARTGLKPRPLLAAIKELETALGRQPGRRWGPRRIDIDLLFYDNLVYSDDVLTLPHPRLAERPFVLAPLADIAPQLVHPLAGQTVAEMLAAVDTGGIARLAEPLFPAESLAASPGRRPDGGE